jgi:predicted DNA-binding WGR domain protein
MSNKIIEKVSLNFTDLTGDRTGCTKLGSNKFWTGWVEQNGSGYNFECRWGPTGTPGSDKGSKRGISESAARDVLAKKVKSKVKKGYTKLDTRDLAAEQAKATAAGVTPTKAAKATKVKAAPARSFHRQVERLLGVIYDSTSNAVRSGLSAQAGATKDNPIGNLSDAQLDHGGEILD